MISDDEGPETDIIRTWSKSLGSLDLSGAQVQSSSLFGASHVSLKLSAIFLPMAKSTTATASWTSAVFD